MEVSDHLHAQAALYLWEKPPVYITGCIGPKASLVALEKKNVSPLMGIENSLVVSPKPSHYIDCIIPAFY
jgi:hypothetical protein